MKLTKPENESYAATVVTIKSITPFEGSDNIVGTPIFGFQAIVGKDTAVGDVGIVFPSETQLSPEFCYENNLHEHGNLNRDEGYPQAVQLDPESPVDEGVCVRVDGMAPYILKAKGPLFREHETKMLDAEAEDLESEGSEV